MKQKANFVTKVLTNRVVLNVIFVIALLNIIGYLMMGRIHEVVYFILLALLTSYFSKNMIIVLSVPMIFVNLFARVQTMREGAETMGEGKTTDKKATDKKATEEETEEVEPKKAEPFEVGRKNGGPNIDYASTVEDAYSELNNILGGDGIKRLTNDTQSLMKQQLELTKAMKDMGPLMEGLGPLLSQAKTLMGSVSADGGLDKMLELSGKLNGKK